MARQKEIRALAPAQRAILRDLEAVAHTCGRPVSEVLASVIAVVAHRRALAVGHDAAWHAAELHREIGRLPENTALENVLNAIEELITTGPFDGPAGRDVLGHLYMVIGRPNSGLGQTFTPYDVARLNATITLIGFTRKGEEPKTVLDPACGSGSMLLAAAHVVEDLGFDPCDTLRLTGIDIDPICVQMCFLQLDARALAGSIVHGDSLTRETRRLWITRREAAFRIAEAAA